MYLNKKVLEMSAIFNDDRDDSKIVVHKTNYKNISSGEYNLIYDDNNLFYLILEDSIVLKFETKDSKKIINNLYSKFEKYNTQFSTIFINEERYHKFNYKVNFFKYEEKVELKVKLSETDDHLILSSNLKNSFKENNVYDISDFTCYDDYATIKSDDKTYSVNKTIRDALVNFKIEDDVIYCTHKGEDEEVKLRIVVGNEIKTNIDGKEVKYLEQMLEIEFNKRKCAYYINSCDKISYENVKDFYAFTYFVIHKANVYGYEPYKRKYFNLNSHKSTICTIMNKKIKLYDTDVYGGFEENNERKVLLLRFKHNNKTDRNYITYTTQPMSKIENQTILLDQITPCERKIEQDDFELPSLIENEEPEPEPEPKPEPKKKSNKKQNNKK